MEHVGSDTVSQVNKVLRDIYQLQSANGSGNNRLLGELFNAVADIYGNIALNPSRTLTQLDWGWPNFNLRSTDAIESSEAQNQPPVFELSDEDLWIQNTIESLPNEKENQVTDDTINLTKSPILELGPAEEIEDTAFELMIDYSNDLVSW